MDQGAMRVTAALCWWNERPEDLVAFVNGAATFVDRIVAYDGAYARYPGATVRSTDAEVSALHDAARASSVDLEIFQPEELWAGQVAKRTALLQHAARGSHWVIVLDADHIVHAPDKRKARHALASAPPTANQVEVDFWTPAGPNAATAWHQRAADTTIRMAAIFRSMDNLRVVKKHWKYEGDRDNKTVKLLYGGPGEYGIAPKYMKIEHRTLFRTEEQVLASRAFCNDRELVVGWTGQEDDLPRLPRPTWDFETLTYA